MSGPLQLKCLQKQSAVDFMGKFNQLNLLSPEVKDSELLKKKGYEFKIKGGGEEASSSPAILTRPNTVPLPPLQGFSINAAFVL